MKVLRNQGYVSTIIFDNYFDTKEEAQLRDQLFNSAQLNSNVTPLQRLDVYDETILIFEAASQALNFLSCIFKETIKEDTPANSFSLRSSLCSGEYFSYQDQIYGEAVNCATRLSYSSRQNEILVGGIEQVHLDNLAENQCDIAYAVRSIEEQRYSISFIDADITSVTLNNFIFNVKYNNQDKKLKVSRYKQITIGRSNNADVFIDNDRISRNHATITFNDDRISIEDHSSNGTYLYIDGHEKYITHDSASLGSGKGYILCGQRQQQNTQNDANDVVENVISFQLSKAR